MNEMKWNETEQNWLISNNLFIYDYDDYECVRVFNGPKIDLHK